ncbi:Peptidyl-prolyl isomerase cwc27 [Dipsacomyces acuminosporus]|nr:Peptidyl-prolyl isomerase cwc27 [Dipsacomyces acuminosporus]
MSNIYISEPPTSGKVILETTAGDIEIELWSKEAPKASRNFIQLCLEGYYDDTVFHRLVPGWIVQGGDPTGTGEGGASVYGSPFADEFHSRLRFNRRGLLAMASSGPDDNGSQFFITLGPTPELQKKNTIFGTVVGDTLFNALKLGEGEVDKETERPVYLKSIKSTRVLDNPFSDIVPRTTRTQITADGSLGPGHPQKKKKKIKAVKNKKLLSFGAEDDDDDADIASAGGSRIKSSHDALDSDPMLSKRSATLPSNAVAAKPKEAKASVEGSEPAGSNRNDRTEQPIQQQDTKTPVVESKIQSVEKDIKKLVERENKRKLAYEQETNTKNENEKEGRAAKPKEHHSALSEMLSQYKSKPSNSLGKASSSGGKKHQREDDLLARLGNFQSKIRSSKKSKDEGHDRANDPKQRSTGCRLHGVAGCQSCQKSEFDKDIDSLGSSAPNKTGGGWLTHSLRFKNSKERSKSEYAPRAEDYVVIDPRQRERSFKKHKA